MSERISPEDNRRTEVKAGTNLDLSRYVLKLEGEEELPENALKNISDSLNHLIQMAKKQHPKNTLELLKISKCFKGVAQFNSNQVPSVLSEEPPNCWSLAVVTLTANISSDLADRLLSSVSEGLPYIRLIEECLDTKEKFVKIGKAAEVVWLRVGTISQVARQGSSGNVSKGENFRGESCSLNWYSHENYYGI